MRQKKTIVLVIGLLMFGTISHASIFPPSKLTLGNSQTGQESIAAAYSGNLPLQDEQEPISSPPRATVEDEDETSKEKILTSTTFVRSDFYQSLHFAQNVFETLDLEILTPPSQK